jgi:antitoxin MazE
MRARTQKWGNSLGLRIPKAFAQELGMADGTDVELQVRDGALVITPQVAPQYDLQSLLDGITRANRYGEQDFGDAVGREVW